MGEKWEGGLEVSYGEIWGFLHMVLGVCMLLIEYKLPRKLNMFSFAGCGFEISFLILMSFVKTYMLFKS